MSRYFSDDFLGERRRHKYLEARLAELKVLVKRHELTTGGRWTDHPREACQLITDILDALPRTPYAEPNG